MKDKFGSFIKFMRSSKRTILLIAITAVTTLIIGSIISSWLSKVTSLNILSLGTIKTQGVEAYWDRNLENKAEMFDWGTIRPGESKNVTLYLRSVSNVDTTLYLNTTNWNPGNVSNAIGLSWNYDGTTIQSGEVIEVTFTLSASSSYSFLLYLVTSDAKEFSFDVIITVSEYQS